MEWRKVKKRTLVMLNSKSGMPSVRRGNERGTSLSSLEVAVPTAERGHAPTILQPQNLPTIITLPLQAWSTMVNYSYKFYPIHQGSSHCQPKRLMHLKSQGLHQRKLQSTYLFLTATVPLPPLSPVPRGMALLRDTPL